LEDLMSERVIEGARLRLVQGDITGQDVDAIVNAANSSLLGGGGVDGAIHRAGGPAILEECREIRRSSYPDGLPPGLAVITTGGNLPARFVIHTVGPVWAGGTRGEEATLEAAYRNSLLLAMERGLRTVAFPSISTGAFGYPIDQAARTALGTIVNFLRDHSHSFDEVRMVLFSSKDKAAYEKALEEIVPAA
jgi:O-acetyl-ADP-ribose deacetylase (regulator of RNase III)